jgi:AbrB family looped-hinge helix DNA binding protein
MSISTPLQATLTSKGQITIPIEIRRMLGLSTGERVTFTQLSDGSVVMRAKTRSLADLDGILQSPHLNHIRIEDMHICE